MGAGLTNRRQRLLRQSVVFPAAAFVMGDDHGYAGPLADLQGLRHRLQHLVALVSHVRGKDAAVGPQSFRQRDDFVGGRGDRGRVGEAGAHADATGVQGLVQ